MLISTQLLSEEGAVDMHDTQFVGPPLDAGPRPAVFYFALSAHDCLFVDPFNQPVLTLLKSDIRIFSVTLPGHDHLSPASAMKYWAKEMDQDPEMIESFTKDVATYINALISQKVITSCGVMGLSRGVFIAAHVAAKIASIQTLLGFAPLTTFAQQNLHRLSDQLYSKTIRCYIGNRDVRVGTSLCFSWLAQLSELAYQRGIRTSPIELIIGPSIGKDGHGTSPATFQAGAAWMAEQLRGAHAT